MGLIGTSEMGKGYSRQKGTIKHCPPFSSLRTEVFREWSVSSGDLLKLHRSTVVLRHVNIHEKHLPPSDKTDCWAPAPDF